MKIDRVWDGNDWRDNVELPMVDGERTSSAIQNSIAIPGIANVHSHAFQRALAGLTEYRVSGDSDDFWTWRQQMYAFLQRLTPDDCYVIACQLYAEMLERGFTSVGEFHYLHNQVDGVLYESISEMSDALVAAAKETGIRMTLLPVLYQRGGFDNQALNQHQGRFYLNTDQYCDLVSRLHQKHVDDEHINIGIAFHSLRAVDLATMQHTLDALKPISHSCPIHIHVAEQIPEVEACLAKHGARPVEYCLDNLPIDGRWCLIHATHMTEEETTRLAKSGAIAGLCPTTEANLGDGIFPARQYLHDKGVYAVGTDSHVATCPFGELRLLEYGQRLFHRQRAILDAKQSNGTTLYRAALSGGAKALGSTWDLDTSDWVIFDADHPILAGKPNERVFDSLVFCENGSALNQVFVGGKCVVKDGQHVRRADYSKNYQSTLRNLMQER